MRRIRRFPFLVLALCFSLSLPGYAHSGRTDSRGGHKDNKNKSGLGSYHYHHGQGPHLHEGGVCPYDDEVVETYTSTKSSSSATSKNRDSATATVSDESSICVTTQKTYLYVDADVDSDRIASIERGAECEVLESTKYFIKTSIDGETGYIRKKHTESK